MSAQNTSVPLYRVYRGGTPVHSEASGTHLGTEAGTPSLKSLSTLYLMKQKAVHPVVRPPVHQQKKCTTGEGGSGTLFEGKNAPVQVAEAAQKIDYQITHDVPFPDDPTAAQLDHARHMLVDCPSIGGKLHCWHCAHCDKALTCTAWRIRRSDVERFRQSEKPYSLYLVEKNTDAPGLSEWLERVAPGPTPDYAAFCPSYWRDCFGCPDYLAGKLRFCARYNRLNANAAEVTQ